MKGRDFMIKFKIFLKKISRILLQTLIILIVIGVICGTYYVVFPRCYETPTTIVGIIDDRVINEPNKDLMIIIFTPENNTVALKNNDASGQDKKYQQNNYKEISQLEVGKTYVFKVFRSFKTKELRIIDYSLAFK